MCFVACLAAHKNSSKSWDLKRTKEKKEKKSKSEKIKSETDRKQPSGTGVDKQSYC